MNQQNLQIENRIQNLPLLYINATANGLRNVEPIRMANENKVLLTRYRMDIKKVALYLNKIKTVFNCTFREYFKW